MSVGYQIVKANGDMITNDKVCRAGCFVSYDHALNYLERMRSVHPRTAQWKDAKIIEVDLTGVA